MPRTKQFAYLHGVLFKQVCEQIGVRPTRGNQDVVKALLKKASGIDSLASLDKFGLSKFITESVMFLAGELAIVVDLPGEYKVEEQDMKTFLKYIYHDRATREVKQNSQSED